MALERVAEERTVEVARFEFAPERTPDASEREFVTVLRVPTTLRVALPAADVPLRTCPVEVAVRRTDWPPLMTDERLAVVPDERVPA